MVNSETEVRPVRPRSLRDGWLVHVRVVRALIIRDIMTRYGRNNIGFLWIVLEPMILTVGVTLLWASIKSPYEHGVHVISLVLSGYMPLTLWRHTSGAGTMLIRRTMQVLYHRRLTLWDVVVSRMLTELIGVSLAFAMVYISLLAIDLVEVIHDLGLMLAGWLLLFGLGVGVALIFAGWTEFSESAERFIQPAQYLIVPLSGTFFLVDWLPKRAQGLIWYNPMIHCYESIRAGFFGETITTYYVFWYPLLWIVVLIAAGLKLLDAAREQVHGS